MHPRSKLSEFHRERAVELFEEGYGYLAVANRLGVKPNAVRRLENRYKLHGRLCLVSKPTKKQYSFETKMEILRRHKAGETKAVLAKEFELSSPDLIGYWLWKVNKDGIDALRPKPKGRPKGSAKPAPLTEEDKLRRENQRLKTELDYLKKLRDLRDQQRG